jgi:hypothetical protein
VIAHSSHYPYYCRQESRFEAASNTQASAFLLSFLHFFLQPFGIIRGMVVLCCIATFWGISACNDVPGPLGSELVPTDSLTLKTITNDSLPLIVSTAIGQFTPKMTTDLALTSTSSPFFIGAARMPDGEECTAAAYIRYQIPVRNDSIRRVDFMSLTERDIIDAELFVRPSTFLIGDTIRKIAPFRVYELRQRWYNDSITRTQNIPSPQSLIVQPFVAQYAQPFTSFGGQVLFDAGPLLSRKRSLPILDKAMILRWIKADTTMWKENIFGLAFVPRISPVSPVSPPAEMVFGFDESSSILVRYRRTQDTTENFLTISEDAQATITACPLPKNPAANEIAVQGGVALRTALDFDILTIPTLSTIHQAELVLPIDTVRSLLSTRGLPLSVQLSFSAPNDPFAQDPMVRVVATGVLNTTTGTARYIFTSGSNTSPNMNALIQQLVKKGGKGKLLLHLTPQVASSTQVFRSDEEQTLIRLVFRRLRESSNPAFRPRLSITYSLRPR